MATDYTTENNPRFLFRAEMHQPFPDWVVAEPMPEAADFLDKAASAFADPKRRKLPICTKSAAFHSVIDLFAHHDQYDEEVFERVKAACAFYGIEADIQPYAELFLGEFEKTAGLAELTDGRYAIRDTINGEEFKLLPLNDADDVSCSAFDLAKMASEDRIPFVMFVDAAREVVKAAADLGVTDVPLLVGRFGVERFADAETALKKIKGREEFCKDASIREQVAKDYLDAISDVDENPTEAMHKIAAIDYNVGIKPNYAVSSLVPTPFDIVFTGELVADVEKAAATNVMIRGVLIPLPAIQSIDNMRASYRLSKSAAESFAKLRDTEDARDLSLTIEHWSDDDQRTILRLAAEKAS